jgi:hypothetical protein
MSTPPAAKPDVPPAIPPHIAARTAVDLTSNPALLADKPKAVAPAPKPIPAAAVAPKPVSIAAQRASNLAKARAAKLFKAQYAANKPERMANAAAKPAVTIESLLARLDEKDAEIDALKTQIALMGGKLPGTRTEIMQLPLGTIENPHAGMKAADIQRVIAREYEGSPERHPSLGDLTPAYVAWLKENYPQDAVIRYYGREDAVVQSARWASKNAPEFAA